MVAQTDATTNCLADECVGRDSGGALLQFCVLQQLIEWHGRADVIALRIVYVQFAQCLHDFSSFNKLRNGLYIQCLADLVNGLPHFVIDIVVRHFTNKLAINLEVVDGQFFKIAK